MSSITNALSNQLQFQQICQDRNENLVATFNGAWQEFLNSVASGRNNEMTNPAPPVPPPAWIVGSVADATTGPGTMSPYGGTVINWPTPVQIGHPVCSQPPLPVVFQPQAPGTGKIAQPTIAGLPTIATVLPGNTQKDSSGNNWYRLP